VYCSECGFQNFEAAHFCSKCGSMLVADDAGPQTTMSFPPIDPATTPDEGAEGDGPMLVIRAGGGRAGEHLPLRSARESIGRATDADLFLDDVTVSREHALIEREADGF
jgi:hypothetical protein